MDPGGLDIVLVTSAFPAFLFGEAFAHILGRLGVSEVTTFMISAPMLMFVWYYLLSWLGFRIVARLMRRDT